MITIPDYLYLLDIAGISIEIVGSYVTSKKAAGFSFSVRIKS
jgi:hypothetical protein